MKRINSWLSVAVALLSVWGASGCASERAPINRVQANALAKSFFVGSLDTPDDDPAFYWRNFVVDGSESQSLIGIGSWSGVDRIRWEITENMLFARRAYQQNPGADDKGDPGTPDGTIVAAYPIESHFDIRRAYNPSTGEELNVIEENTTDRVWSEREYFRVDWSINLVNTPQWYDMFAGRIFGDIQVTPLSYYVNDPGADDAPHFDVDQGYFDITSKFLVEPAGSPSPFSDVNGRVPTCLVLGVYTGSAIDGCDPQEAVIRSSYWRVDQVDPDQDFEPFENSRATLDIVGNPGGLGDSLSEGIVTPPRVDWDPQYGYTDPNFHRFMHVHNIWKQSHQTVGSCSSNDDCGGNGSVCLASGTCTVPCDYGARGDVDDNGTDDQCENADTGYAGSEGSQCSARNRCTVPLRDREIKPIGYWMNKETPLGLTDTLDADGNVVERGPTEDLAYTWNQALKLSVAKAWETECRATGGDRDACHEEYFEVDDNGKTEIEMVSYGGWGIEKVKPMDDVLVMCHNPVRDYDDPLCGEAGYSARVGDLRHNFVFYWPFASDAPWGGIANWNADPLTGQIIGSSATTMGRSATFAAAFIRDIIMVANGELDMSDITGGTTAYLYQKGLRDGRKPISFTPEELEKRTQIVDPTHAMQQIAPNVTATSMGDLRMDLLNIKRNISAGQGPTGTAQLEYDALADTLRGSVYEAQLVDPSRLVDSAGLSPDTAVTDDVMDAVSPLRGGDFFTSQSAQRAMNGRMQARGVCFPEPEMTSVGNQDIQGVARFFAEKYSNDVLRKRFKDELGDASDDALSRRRAELIYDDLWKESYKGIALHEMGHSLGMLHQFASSYDSTNYDPQYWQLRTQEGQVTASCDGNPRSGDVYSASADTCMGPRYLDPETDDELGQAEESRPGINYFAHTSTMEYQNERFFESVGLGQYDVFTMNVLYGRVLQTFDEREMPLQLQAEFSPRNASQLIDDHLAFVEDGNGGGFVQSIHYTEEARRMHLFDPDRCRDATDAEAEHAAWRIVHGKVCAPPSKDYAFWQDMQDARFLGGWAVPRLTVRTGMPGAGNVRWPYWWGATTNSYPHTNSNDAGADIYELTTETVRKFQYSYPFQYFRRGRRDWYYPSIPSRTAGAFFERLRAYHWGIAITNASLRTFGEAQFEAAARDDNFWRPFLLAESQMFDSIAAALVAPQIGSYRPAPNFTPSDSTRPLFDPDGASDAAGMFTIDAATGRYIDPAFDGGPAAGGSWDYQNWVAWTGFGIEKEDAARALTDGRGVFFLISRESYLDGRNLNISFRSDMPQAIDRLLGGVLSGDWETIAPHVERGELFPAVELLDLGEDEPTRPDDAVLLFPNISYRQQLGALIWGHLFSRLSTDNVLADKLRVWVDGLTGEINIPETDQVRFFNPESGITYIARRFGPQTIDGKEVDAGIGSRMLHRANLLLSEAFEVERDDDGNPLLDEFGEPILTRDDEGRVIPIIDDVRGDTGVPINRLRSYVGLLDAAVQINYLVGFGPFPQAGP